MIVWRRPCAAREPGTDPALLARARARARHAVGAARAAERRGGRRDRSARGSGDDARRALLRRLRRGDGRQPAAPAPAAHRARGGRRRARRRQRATWCADIGPRAVSRTVLLRLARLPDEAVARRARRRGARRERRSRRPSRRSPELDEREVAAARPPRSRAPRSCAPEPPLGFVHPLVRDAVYHELPPGERELQHARAAARAARRGRAAEQVAAHLLAMPRRGEAWVANVLDEAARAALHTRRAGERGRLPHARARGAAAGRAGGRSCCSSSGSPRRSRTGRPRSTTCARPTTCSTTRASARWRPACWRATLLFTGDPDAAAAFARGRPRDLPEDCADERQALEAVELSSAYFSAPSRRTPSGSSRCPTTSSATAPAGGCSPPRGVRADDAGRVPRASRRARPARRGRTARCSRRTTASSG